MHLESSKDWEFCDWKYLYYFKISGFFWELIIEHLLVSYYMLSVLIFTLHRFSQLFLTMTTWSKTYYAYFVDDPTENNRGYIICLRPT